MHSIQVTVRSGKGLHARPASLFVQAAARQPATVTVGRPGQAPVDSRSLLSVLALAAGHGETLELSASGDGALESLEALASLLASDLDATA
ncbi:MULTISPECIES: HPr family phosphocarrier protein [Streptomyces]|uniref:Phosphocarrier protein HPr n=1 Tax=Streptomyces katrae TaxID=68223 RepID=A0A0F4JT38_9ACTN|nr:HPr family phosphocarrier protein [Streptomyces katrae]KJY36979.1 dihydroxyacetone kinase [Streptomyces katrae]MCF3178563.1 HPr family phosphocarrier protein [Streptomyces polychromogenes]